SGYLISVGYTPDCNGVHVCTVGYLRVERNAKPEMQQDRDGNEITETVMLADNIKGYYTPGHPMGSYFPPVIQWNLGDILYTVSWDDKFADKDALKAMTNSILKEKETMQDEINSLVTDAEKAFNADENLFILDQTKTQFLAKKG